MKISKTERPFKQITVHYLHSESELISDCLNWLISFRTHDPVALAFTVWVPPFDNFDKFFENHFKQTVKDSPKLIVAELKTRAMELLDKEDAGYIKFVFVVQEK